MRVRARVARRSRRFMTIRSQNTGAHGWNIRVQAVACPHSEVERQPTGPNAREPSSGVPSFLDVLYRKIDLILVTMRHWRFGKKGVRGGQEPHSAKWPLVLLRLPMDKNAAQRGEQQATIKRCSPIRDRAESTGRCP